MGDKMATIRKYRGTAVDFFTVLLLAFVILCFELFGKPHKNGFFCDDDSIRYPYQDTPTVSTGLLTSVCLSLPAIAAFVIEGLRLFNSTTPRDSYKSVGIRFLKSCYEILGVFLFGAGLNQVTVDLAKYFTHRGRLRPHFYTVCLPSVDCNSLPAHQYITQFDCKGDAAIVNEARLSFPSGHAALAFYVAIYTSAYLYHRMVWQGSALCKYLFQGILFLLAWYTALSRVHDYMHHFTDVIAGSLIGSSWAIFVTYFVIDLRLRNNNSTEENRVLRQTQISTQLGPNYNSLEYIVNFD